MTSKTRILFLIMISLAALALAGCGGTPCSSTQNFTSAGSGGGGAVNAGGNVCGASGGGGNGPAAAFAFFLGNGVETGALSTSGAFTTVTQTTPPALSGSTIDSMTVVGNYLYLPFGDTTSVVQGLTIDHTT